MVDFSPTSIWKLSILLIEEMFNASQVPTSSKLRCMISSGFCNAATAFLTALSLILFFMSDMIFLLIPVFLKLPFNFNLARNLGSDITAEKVLEQVDAWLESLPGAGVADWVTGSHDIGRVASRVSDQGSFQKF